MNKLGPVVVEAIVRIDVLGHRWQRLVAANRGLQVVDSRSWVQLVVSGVVVYKCEWNLMSRASLDKGMRSMLMYAGEVSLNRNR